MSRRAPTPFRAVLPLVLLVGCGPLSPEAQETNRYLTQFQPLTVENGHLAERVLVLAANVYNEEGDADALAEAWTRDVVPLSEHLYNQAQFVDPPSSWKGRHDQIVELWGERAQAYRSLSEALVRSDLDEWRKARAKATEVKLAEEEWFKEVNQVLAPSGLSLDPTP